MLKNFVYQIKKPYHFLKTGLLKGLPAQIKYGFPEKKLKIIAITGTDGKTSSSTLLYHVLKTAGKKVALLSTVAAYMGNEEIETGLHVTSPNPEDLHKLMKKMVEKKIEYLVLEFTSHGAYQYRLWGIHPEIAGITNITHEHLDYHGSQENYIEAKASFLKKAPIIVLNKDDQNFFKLRRVLPARNHQYLYYSAEDSLQKELREAIQKRFPEKYNQMNARLVSTIAHQVGVEDASLAQGIKEFPGVPGRMQFVPTGKKFQVVVDFAHTPNALEKALKSLQEKMKREKMTGKLIAVFGTAGLRDRTKRPLMGKIAADNTNLSIFTAEDPRTEDIWSIIRQMKEQLTEGHNKIISIADRREAIEFALTKVAKKGDLIGIFGKGPEKSMCYGKIEYPWSDVGVVKEILK